MGCFPKTLQPGRIFASIKAKARPNRCLCFLFFATNSVSLVCYKQPPEWKTMDDTSFPRAQKQAPTLHQDRPVCIPRPQCQSVYSVVYIHKILMLSTDVFGRIPRPKEQPTLHGWLLLLERRGAPAAPEWLPLPNACKQISTCRQSFSRIASRILLHSHTGHFLLDTVFESAGPG